MTPILVRPVREQLEHDRVIRQLQAKWRRKYTVGINVGAEQTSAVVVGENILYPDLILTPPGARRPEIIVEVETGESVNNLEAMAEWVRLAQIRAQFHLYVPVGSAKLAQHLCNEHKIPVVEICSYSRIGDEIKFATVFKGAPVPHPAPRREPAPAAAPATRAAAPRRTAANGGGARANGTATRKTATRRPAAKPTATKRPRAAKKTAAKPAHSQKRK